LRASTLKEQSISNHIRPQTSGYGYANCQHVSSVLSEISKSFIYCCANNFPT